MDMGTYPSRKSLPPGLRVLAQKKKKPSLPNHIEAGQNSETVGEQKVWLVDRKDVVKSHPRTRRNRSQDES
jgi:hypothetical protein